MIVVPAKAGTQSFDRPVCTTWLWIPAFAGMTDFGFRKDSGTGEVKGKIATKV